MLFLLFIFDSDIILVIGVQEQLDGHRACLYYYNNKWHLSTICTYSIPSYLSSPLSSLTFPLSCLLFAQLVEPDSPCSLLAWKDDSTMSNITTKKVAKPDNNNNNNKNNNSENDKDHIDDSPLSFNDSIAFEEKFWKVWNEVGYQLPQDTSKYVFSISV